MALLKRGSDRWLVGYDTEMFQSVSEQVSIKLNGYGSSELAAGRVFDRLGRLGVVLVTN